MDPGPFFYIHITVYFLQELFTFLQTNIYYHTICLILCLQQTGEIDNLTASWGKVLWLCCVQVPRCCWRQSCTLDRRHILILRSRRQSQLASTFRSGFFLLLVRLNLVFILRENLPLCSWYLPLGVPNWAASTAIKQAFSGTIAGEKEDFCKGSLSLPIFYFVIVLLTFFTLFLFAFFYQNTKKIVPFIVGISLLLLLVHYVVL
jgi:hypothetical protein